MNLEWNEEHPNYHVARITFSAVGINAEAVAKVFLVAGGYVVETGVGASLQTDGGTLPFEAAKELAARMLKHQLRTLQAQLQGALKDGEEQGFGEAKPDGG